jgi:threonylcarbamoyladenosine tRNA methylthiotransferase MtaB
MKRGFHVENFGCRAARADGEAVGDRLRSAGLCERQLSEADAVIVNTCSVTAEADRSARAFIRRVHRRNPAARIVVTGCYAQRAPEELAAMDGVAAVIGNSHKALAPEIIRNLLGTSGQVAVARAESGLVQIATTPAVSAPPQVIWADDEFAHSFLEESQVLPGAQTRPNLKIQEGCGNRCTYCVIPYTRGRSRSLPAAAVLKQVEGFIAAGGQELVLSGINLGRWGWDLPRTGEIHAPRRLAELVRQILAGTELARLRLSSIEPMDWDPELIGQMAEHGASGRLARHAHVPLQSGSDGVLRRMHRRYRPWHYAEKIEAMLRAVGPELTLGADVMVGFPGETEAEFEETLELVRSLPFGYLHIFPFSPRPGTPGWALHAENPVPPPIVEDRLARLRALAAEKSRAHRSAMVGREFEAITLHSPAELERQGRTAAMTENFLPVEVLGRIEANHLLRLRVTGLTAEGALEAVVAQAR